MNLTQLMNLGPFFLLLRIYEYQKSRVRESKYKILKKMLHRRMKYPDMFPMPFYAPG